MSEDCGRQTAWATKDAFHCMTFNRLDRRSTCVEQDNTIVGRSREGSKCGAKTANVGCVSSVVDRF